ncbi:MAG: hypothetical protein ABIN24_02975 [Dyadobacter sp.]
MKKFILYSITLFLCNTALAQDSLKISYSEVQDTLVKQHFIDRYENIFMTKIPSRHIFKVDYLSSEGKGTGINMAYEYKILRAFSLEAGVFIQTSDDANGLTVDTFKDRFYLQNLSFNAKARWYFNMDKRIKMGLSANNFSGRYLAFRIDESIQSHINWMYPYGGIHKLNLQYGFQSRFFKNGHADFSAGISRLAFRGDGARLEIDKYTINTQAMFGLAFGDWENNSIAPLCDALFCDEQLKDQWKVNFPDINVGLKLQSINTGLAYERKIGKSPFSATAEWSGMLYNSMLTSTDGSSDINFVNREINVSAGLQLRYYFLQKRRILKGRDGFSFSGPYVGLRGNYTYSHSYYRFYDEKEEGSYDKWRTGITAGYQQRILKRFFINADLTRWGSSVRIQNRGITRNWFLTIGLGFTF